MIFRQVLLITLISLTGSTFADKSKRLLTPEEQARFILPGYDGIGQPGGYEPHPNGASLFPLSHSYGTGVEVANVDSRLHNGYLNVPLPHINSVWDLSGKLRTDYSPTAVNYGHLVQPAFDKDEWRPDDVAALVQARRDRELAVGQTGQRSEPVAVATLPWDYEPVKCRPPACNPLVHHVGTAVEIEPRDDWKLSGDLDFPVVQRKSGQWVRFPLSGDIGWETSPLALAYGHGLTPVDPFRRAEDSLAQSQDLGRTQFRSQGQGAREFGTQGGRQQFRDQGNVLARAFRRRRRQKRQIASAGFLPTLLRQKRQALGAGWLPMTGPGPTLWTGLASKDYRIVPPGYDLQNTYPAFLGRLMTNTGYRSHPDKPRNFADLRGYNEEYNQYRQAFYPAAQNVQQQQQQAAAVAAGQAQGGVPPLPPTRAADSANGSGGTASRRLLQNGAPPPDLWVDTTR